MKHTPRTQSTTSLPRSPGDDSGARSRRYLLMMAIRLVCLAAMILVTPYSWYTWVFAAGAIVLPYIAVVLANVGEDTHAPDLQAPERALPAAPSDVPSQAWSAAPVIRIDETRSIDPAPGDSRE